MIEISNLRIEKYIGGGSRLVADIMSDVERMDKENTIWISVQDEYSYMLEDRVYDMFLFLPVYMCMYYHTDLYIRGNVSKILYRNVVDYLQPLMCDFSHDLDCIKVYVDGFCEVEKGDKHVIGTGISCGVDCLSTIYKYFVQENDADYKLTHLFMFNCGWHGEYEDSATIELFKKRCEHNKKAADEIGLPMIKVDSNLHAFLYKLDDKASFFNIYTICFALEKGLEQYYISSSLSYDEVVEYGKTGKNLDFSEYADPIAIPLFQNKALRVVSDGCQYTRVEKIRRIVDWLIAQKYLNVCCRHSNDLGADETNCSCCIKCNRTLISLDGMGKLDCFLNVFDIDAYKQNKKKLLEEIVWVGKRNVFYAEILDLYRKNGLALPPKYLILLKKIFGKIFRLGGNAMSRIMGYYNA